MGAPMPAYDEKGLKLRNEPHIARHFKAWIEELNQDPNLSQMAIPLIIENHYDAITDTISTTNLFLIKKAFLKYLGRHEEAWKFKKADERKELLKAKSIKALEIFFNSYDPSEETITREAEYDNCKALHILYGNPRIKELSSKYIGAISEGAYNFIQDIKFLFYSSMSKMKLTPEEATLKEEYLRQMYTHHDELLDYATILQSQTAEQVKKDLAFMKSNEGEIKTWEIKMEKIKAECQEFIEKSGKEADRTMILEWKRSELKQEALLAEIQSDVGNIGNVRKKFLEEEKELRVKKYQTEQQLFAALQQYDRDMQERQEIYEYKKDIYEREKEQLTQLQSRYDEQTQEFQMMMKEKKEYELRLSEGRLYELKCKSSARKIQRFYRNYRSLLLLNSKKMDVQKAQTKLKKKKSKI